MKFQLVPILIFSIIHFPFAKSKCAGEIYNFEIDLETDYQAQSFDGWVYNVQNGREWFYHSSWTGLPATGVFLVDGNSGPVGEAFEVNGFFPPYYLNPKLFFYFELKYYSTTDASLRNVIMNGIPVPEHVLPKSPAMEWTTIEFQARSPLLPKFPQIRIMMSSQSAEFFLIESLSTLICDESVTTTETLPPPTPTTGTPQSTSTTMEPSSSSPPTTEIEDGSIDSLMIGLIILDILLFLCLSLILYICCRGNGKTVSSTYIR